MATAVNGWDFVLLFAYISAALLLAAFFRKQFSFFQRMMVPTAIIAGLIVLLCSGQIFGIMNISLDHLNIVVYHLLTGIFILIGLKGGRQKYRRAVLTTTVMIGQGYAIMALTGCIFTLIWIRALFPGFFPSFSMLPLLGFGFDQMTATGIGLQWEQAGFIGGGRAAFSFGVMGLFWAYLGGVIMILWARKGQEKCNIVPSLSPGARQGVIPRESKKPISGRLTTAPESLESLALHLALIGFLYLLTFSCINQLVAWLGRFSGAGELFGGLLWNYNFLFGLFLGYLARKIIDWLDLGYLFDRGTLQRITGAMVDYMIAASLAALPLLIYASYWVEVVILSLISGLALVFFAFYASRKMHSEHQLARSAALFGYLTGTIAAAVALLRMVDPEFDSPAAEDLGWAGGLALVIGLPLLLLVNYPLYGFFAGEPLRYLLITLGLFAAYGLLLSLIWFVWNRAAAKNNKVVQPDSDQ